MTKLKALCYNRNIRKQEKGKKMQEYEIRFWNSENNQRDNKIWIFETDWELDEKVLKYMEEKDYTHAEIYEIHYVDTLKK